MQLWLAHHCMESQPRPMAGPEQPADRLDRLEAEMRAVCERYLINTSRTATAVLSYWRLLLFKAGNDVVLHPTTTIDEAKMVVNHLDLSLSLPDWRQMLQDMLIEAGQILEEELLLGSAAPQYRVKQLQDNPAEQGQGWCFLNDPRNRAQLKVADDWLIERLKTEPREFIREDDGIHYRRSTINKYLRANQSFLRLLAVLTYMGSGLPPWRDELMQITWRNWQTPRNVYISHGLVVLVTGYHKSQHRVGARPLARFLPPSVGELLVRYIIYVPRFLGFLHCCLRQAPPTAFLFCEGDVPWEGQRLTRCLREQTTLRLGQGIVPQQWRHMAIALDRRVLQGVGCRAHGVVQAMETENGGGEDWSGSELEGIEEEMEDGRMHPVAGATINHLQAAHTARVGNKVYGNDLSLKQGMTDALLAAYRTVSEKWHGFAGLDGEAATGDKRARSGSEVKVMVKRRARAGQAGSLLGVRKKAWNWPAIQEGLCQLFGPGAEARSPTQRDALRLLASCRPENIVVMPTASGKTVLFVLPTLLPHAEVTVVILPLVALRQDLIRRCTEWKIPFQHYGPGSTQVKPLILVDVQQASGADFKTLLQRLQAAGRLDRLVLDEAHLLLTAGHYREHLGLLVELRRFDCPFVCLSATLPPFGEQELCQLLAMTVPVVIRTSGDRPNICYEVVHVRQVAHVRPGQGYVSPEEQLLDEAVRILRQSLEAQADDPAGRMICFVRRKAIGATLAEQLGCHLYHADVADRAGTMTAWVEGKRGWTIRRYG